METAQPQNSQPIQPEVQPEEQATPQPAKANSLPGSFHNFSKRNMILYICLGVVLLFIIIISISAVANLGTNNNPIVQKKTTPVVVVKAKPTLMPTGLPPTPTPIPSTYWAVYVDNVNDYSINYPTNWTSISSGFADPNTGQLLVALNVTGTDPVTAQSAFAAQNNNGGPASNIQTASHTALNGQPYIDTTVTSTQKDQKGNLIEEGKLYAAFIAISSNNTLELSGPYQYKQTIDEMVATFALFPVVNQADITTWQTYSTMFGNYSFEYPPDYSLQQQIKQDSSSSQQMQNPNFVQLFSPTVIQNQFQISIYYQQNYNNYTLTQAIDNLKDCDSISSTNARQIAFAGQIAYFFPDEPCGVYPVTYIYVMNNNIFYTITISADVDYEQIKSSTDPILNTFTFTNSNNDN